MAAAVTIKLDMHTHCEYSPDSDTPVAEQARTIAELGLQVICATDHNTIEGALRLRELAAGFRVIIGEEVSSREGEIIGLFLERTVPRDLSAEETIAAIHEQGGLVCVPHPFSHNRPSHLRRETLDRLWPQIDAIEILNARESVSDDNRKAETYARERNIPGAVGSDAHRIADLGRAWLECPDFTGPDDFLDAIRAGTVHRPPSGWRSWLGKGSTLP